MLWPMAAIWAVYSLRHSSEMLSWGSSSSSCPSMAGTGAPGSWAVALARASLKAL